jgi:hypothetical protein
VPVFAALYSSEDEIADMEFSWSHIALVIEPQHLLVLGAPR